MKLRKRGPRIEGGGRVWSKGAWVSVPQTCDCKRLCILKEGTEAIRSPLLLLSYLLLRGQNGQIPMKSLRFPSDTLLPSHPTAKRSFTFYSRTMHFCDLTYFSHGIVSPRNWSSRWCRHEPAQEFTSSLTAHREKRISYFRCFPTFFFFSCWRTLY